MQTLTFDVNGMSCGGCASSVKQAVVEIDGVSQVEINLSPGSATVQVDPARVTSAQIEAAISKLGYQVKSRLPTQYSQTDS